MPKFRRKWAVFGAFFRIKRSPTNTTRKNTARVAEDVLNCPSNACARAKLPFSYPRCHDTRFRGACSPNERNSDKSKSPAPTFAANRPKRAQFAQFCVRGLSHYGCGELKRPLFSGKSNNGARGARTPGGVGWVGWSINSCTRDPDSETGLATKKGNPDGEWARFWGLFGRVLRCFARTLFPKPT